MTVVSSTPSLNGLHRCRWLVRQTSDVSSGYPDIDMTAVPARAAKPVTSAPRPSGRMLSTITTSTCEVRRNARASRTVVTELTWYAGSSSACRVSATSGSSSTTRICGKQGIGTYPSTLLSRTSLLSQPSGRVFILCARQAKDCILAAARLRDCECSQRHCC